MQQIIWKPKTSAKIYYEDQGHGRPILLVHGWLRSSRFWQRNAPELAKAFRVGQQRVMVHPT